MKRFVEGTVTLIFWSLRVPVSICEHLALDNELWVRPVQIVDRFLRKLLEIPDEPLCDLPVLNATGAKSWSDLQKRGFTGQSALFVGLTDSSSRDGLHRSHWTRSSFLQKFGDYLVQTSNKRYDVGFEIDTTLTVREFAETARSINRSMVATAYNTALETTMLREQTFPHFLKDFDLRPVVQVGAASGSGTHLHNHAETWLWLLHGAKAWWVADHHPPTKQVTDEKQTHTGHPCSWLKAGAVKGLTFCLQRAGDVIYLSDELYHATCNIGDWVLGVGAQGRVPDDWPLFSKVVHRNDVKMVKQLVKKGTVNVNDKMTHKDPSISVDHPPLHKAALKNFSSMVAFLIEQRADVKSKINMEPQNEIQALHWAAANGHRDVANLLLQGRASVHSTFSDGTSALNLAIISGDYDLVMLLIASRADVQGRNRDGEQPLHYSSQGGYTRQSELLIHGGADVDARDNKGMTPLFRAAMNDKPEMMKYLLERSVDPLVQDLNGQTALNQALTRGHRAVVRLLAEYAPRCAATWDRAGYQPVHYAIQKGRADLIDLLLDQGGQDINGVLQDGNTALHLAVRSGSLKTVERVQWHGADLSAHDGKHGVSSLALAAMLGHGEISQYLIEARAEVGQMEVEALRHAATSARSSAKRRKRRRRKAEL